MKGFTGDWLALREPRDARSRDPVLAAELRDWVGGAIPLRCLDLACGTGSNARYLAPRLGGRQEWRLVDHDQRLLDALPEAMRAWAATRRYRLTRQEDRLTVVGPGFSSSFLPVVLDLSVGVEALSLPDGCRMVTASALLDLVSEPWLRGLARSCRGARVAVLLALTYDGRIEFRPGVEGDRRVKDLINRHQRGDKGFGPALGPTAVAAAGRLFAACGYRVRSAPSDWHLGLGDGPLQSALMEGWLEAAGALAPHREIDLERWGRARRAWLAAGRSEIRVGHRDLLALPPP
jgi:SAM-dependent methyltransferase